MKRLCSLELIRKLWWDKMTVERSKPKGAGKSSFDLINPATLAQVLPAGPGSVVLDLACGRGHYATFLSGIVGDAGMVYAVDLWEEGLQLLAEAIEQRNITNIQPMLADATGEIAIEAGTVDVCLMATVLHDFEEMGRGDAVVRQVRSLLRPDGHLAVIEFKKIDGPPGPPRKIRLSEQETEAIVTGCGFGKVRSVDMGEYSYLTLFQSI